MNKKSDQEIEQEGGYAFPAEQNTNYPGGLSQSGMTLRDWFAGQALCGLSAYCGAIDVRRAYQLADDMLKVREMKTYE